MSSPLSLARRKLRARGWSAVATLCFGTLAAMAARAELPVETVGTTALPASTVNRIYVTDPVLNHIVDGRMHVVDGNNMRYLGMLGTGTAASTALTPDGQHIVVVTTYYTRLQRGTRADVVEVYDAKDLSLLHEIEIPSKHIQSLITKPLLAFTQDGRYLLVQNATPATSISIVDLQEKRFVSETPNPGCYGAIAWKDGSRRFSSLCGDGTLITFEVDATGHAGQPVRSPQFFDADKDPIYSHFERDGDSVVFISYFGTVHQVRLNGEQPTFDSTWSLLDGKDQKGGWRPGGYQLFAIDSASRRLIVGMHPKGVDGSHKNPAVELWAFHLDSHRRLQRVPGHNALAMIATPGPQGRLVLLDGQQGNLVSLDLRTPNGLKKPLLSSAPVGEMPIYLDQTP